MPEVLQHGYTGTGERAKMKGSRLLLALA